MINNNSIVNLSSIGKIITGKTPPRNNHEYYDTVGMPFVTPTDIQFDRKFTTTERYISAKGADAMKSYIVPEKSISYVCIGATIGKITFNRTASITNQQINTLVTNSCADSEFMFYKLKTIEQIVKSIAGGATTPIINKTDFGNIEILIPSIERQRKIGYLLALFDDKIEINNKLNKVLQDTIKLIYDYWFVQFDFPDENGRPYKSSGGKMVYNDQLKREIPEGWSAKKITDLYQFDRGTEVGKQAYRDKQVNENYVKFYRLQDIDTDCNTWVDSSNNKLRIVKPGDVLISLDASIGKIENNANGAISGGFRHVHKDGADFSATIWTILQSDYVQKSLQQYSSGRGSTLIHAGSLIDYINLAYNESVYDKFQKVIEPMYNLIITNKQQSQQLANLRDWLLPMLMNGQVKIN